MSLVSGDQNRTPSTTRNIHGRAIPMSIGTKHPCIAPFSYQHTAPGYGLPATKYYFRSGVRRSLIRWSAMFFFVASAQPVSIHLGTCPPRR